MFGSQTGGGSLEGTDESIEPLSYVATPKNCNVRFKRPKINEKETGAVCLLTKAEGDFEPTTLNCLIVRRRCNNFTIITDRLNIIFGR